MQPASTIAVLETEPWWAPELERRFQSEDVHVRSRSDLRGLFEVLDEDETTVVVLHVPAGPADVLTCLDRLAQRARRPAIVAVLDRETADLEWHLRELGADSIVDRFIGGAELATVCRRLAPAAITSDTTFTSTTETAAPS